MTNRLKIILIASGITLLSGTILGTVWAWDFEVLVIALVCSSFSLPTVIAFAASYGSVSKKLLSVVLLMIPVLYLGIGLTQQIVDLGIGDADDGAVMAYILVIMGVAGIAGSAAVPLLKPTI